jgi:hypothetical protein
VESRAIVYLKEVQMLVQRDGSVPLHPFFLHLFFNNLRSFLRLVNGPNNIFSSEIESPILMYDAKQFFRGFFEKTGSVQI